MTLKSDARYYRIRPFTGLIIITLFTIFTGLACDQAKDAPPANKTAPANVSAQVKPTETEVKQTESKPEGKEVKAADGPALKSITPPEGAILGGVLNSLATSLPEPDADAAKKANASGTVTVEVVVNEKGEVTASSVVSGPQPLWSAAGNAARQARFAPPLHDGKAVKVAGVLTYEFAK